LIFLIAALIAALAFNGCGSTNQQAAGAPNGGAPPAPGLPAAIPAAEPVLLYNGTGTSSTDVSAVESVLDTLNVAYTTADASQLEAMSEPEVAGYQLIIVPGGNSITIGEGLTTAASSMIQGAVQDYGVHYLGVCAGAFYGGYSVYNGVNLTGGVWFDFYADEYNGIHVEAVELSFPSGGPLDVYWQDGPQLSGWGSVVAKFPDGTPAIVEGQSGKGFVIFTGVHAEAPASWREGMTFTTPLAVDLAYAGTVVQAALNGTALQHF
jgi:glutamine amidotransferase-like uncharacterized protein